MVDLVKYTENNTANSVKKAVQKRTVFEKKEVKFFVNGKDTMAVSAVYKFTGHIGRTFLRIFYSASGAETTFAIDEIIDEYLNHIEDVKPITARQCIKLLPMIAKNKPELKGDIVSALQKADISIYADSMQSLVYNDIQKSLAEIQ